MGCHCAPLETTYGSRRAWKSCRRYELRLLPGGLSFSKARALTHLERPIDEEAMVDLARTATAAQLDRLVAGHRQLDRQIDDYSVGGDGSAEPSVDDGGWSRRCYRQRDLPDGMVEIRLVVTADVATVIDAAVDARVEQILATTDQDAVPDRSVSERVAERGGWPAIRADAAIELLGGSVEPGQAELDIDLTVTVSADGDPGDVDPSHTATVVTGARLPSEVTRRHGCDATIRLTNHSTGDAQTPMIGVGRRTKIVPRWLRRHLDRERPPPKTVPRNRHRG